MAPSTVRIDFEGVSAGDAARLAGALESHLNDVLRADAPQCKATLERSDPQSQMLGDHVLIATAMEMMSEVPQHIVGGFLAHLVLHAILGWWERQGRPRLRVESSNGKSASLGPETHDGEAVLQESVAVLDSPKPS